MEIPAAPITYVPHPALPRLRPFIRRFMVGACDADVTFRPAPTGYCYLGRIFGTGDMFAVVDGKQIINASRWNVSGQIYKGDVEVRCEAGSVQVVGEFTASGFHRLLHMKGSLITDLAVDIATINPSLHARLASGFGDPGDETARLGSVAARLESLVVDALPPNKLIEAAVAEIEASNGTQRVSAIAEALNVSERHLAREFTDIVGISPKYFGQVRQINYALEILYTDEALL